MPDPGTASLPSVPWQRLQARCGFTQGRLLRPAMPFPFLPCRRHCRCRVCLARRHSTVVVFPVTHASSDGRWNIACRSRPRGRLRQTDLTKVVPIAYDEHGGYYDHVPPPPALAPDAIPPDVPAGESTYNGFAQYGFRVPCAVISPYARPRYVSHRVFDHTSICALVEAKWNLPAMTYRDANAANMLDMLDLRRPHFAEPPTLAEPLLVTDPSALSCSTTGPGTIPPPGSVTPPR
jgi:hypothetical protein